MCREMGVITGEVTCPRCSKASRGISEGGQAAVIDVLDPRGAQPITEEPDGPSPPAVQGTEELSPGLMGPSRAYCLAAQP